MARIDDAVRRILRVKFAMGLMDERARRTRPTAAAGERSARPSTARWRGEAVRESLVLLKNDKHSAAAREERSSASTWPARGADDIGNPGRRLDHHWQGAGRQAGPDRARRSWRRSRRPCPRPRPGDVLEGRLGSGGRGRRRRGRGRAALRRVQGRPHRSRARTRRTVDAIARRAQGRHAGRGRGCSPAGRWSSRTSSDWPTRSWPPGCRAPRAGVADVLFGDYKPTGKLPMSWPRTNAQIPINGGDATYDPLFKYGYGLTY